MLKNKFKNKTLRHCSGQAGFSLLLSTVLIGAISLSIAVSILIMGLDSSRTSFVNQQSNQSKSIVNACAENALQEIRDNENFEGYGSLNFIKGSCGYFIINNGGESRNIVVSSTVATMIRKVEINIDTINPQINISSWQEVETLSGESAGVVVSGSVEITINQVNAWGSGAQFEAIVENISGAIVENLRLRMYVDPALVSNIWDVDVLETNADNLLLALPSWRSADLAIDEIYDFGFNLNTEEYPSIVWEEYQAPVAPSGSVNINTNTVNTWGSGAQFETILENTSAVNVENLRLRMYIDSALVSSIWDVDVLETNSNDLLLGLPSWRSSDLAAGEIYDFGYTLDTETPPDVVWEQN